MGAGITKHAEGHDNQSDRDKLKKSDIPSKSSLRRKSLNNMSKSSMNSLPDDTNDDQPGENGGQVAAYTSDEEEDAEEGYESGVEYEINLGNYCNQKIEESNVERTSTAGGKKIRVFDDDEASWISNMYLPTNFDPAHQQISPSSFLKLEYVYGYDCRRCRNNLFYISDNRVLYTMGTIAIVFDRASNTQRFFQGHDSEIVSIALHRKTGVVATGQIGQSPKICIWDVNTMNHLATLEGYHKRAIVSMAFSPDGNKIVSVGLDENHSVAVYEWKLCRVLASYRCDTCRICEVKWNPYSNEEFVTVGQKHMYFWKLNGFTLHPVKGRFGKLSVRKTILSITFLKNVVLTGTIAGDILIWKQHVLRHVIDAHNGPVTTLQTYNKGVVSGGKDGFVHVWDSQTFRRKVSFNLNKATSQNSLPYMLYGNSVRSLDLRQSKVIVGTISSNIYEIGLQTGKQTLVMLGHFGDGFSSLNTSGYFTALDLHPSKHLMATVADDHTLRFWNIYEKKLVSWIVVDRNPTAICFSPEKGTYIAVGYRDGSFAVFSASDLKSGPVMKRKDRKGSINVLKFSPNGKILAVASSDSTSIDLYSTEHLRYVGQCCGHPHPVTHIDWSCDSQFIQSNSFQDMIKSTGFDEIEEVEDVPIIKEHKEALNHKELLFFSIGKDGEYNKIVNPREVRDLEWSEVSCLLHWGVMGIYDNSKRSYEAISCLHRSRTKSLLVSGQKNGFLKLYRYPCVSALLSKEGPAPSISFANSVDISLNASAHSSLYSQKQTHSLFLSHSERIQAIKFSFNDSYIISAGSNDRCICQWRLCN